jgi:hypothetical protein
VGLLVLGTLPLQPARAATGTVAILKSSDNYSNSYYQRSTV